MCVFACLLLMLPYSPATSAAIKALFMLRFSFFWGFEWNQDTGRNHLSAKSCAIDNCGCRKTRERQRYNFAAIIIIRNLQFVSYLLVQSKVDFFCPTDLEDTCLASNAVLAKWKWYFKMYNCNMQVRHRGPYFSSSDLHFWSIQSISMLVMGAPSVTEQRLCGWQLLKVDWAKSSEEHQLLGLRNSGC